MSFAAGRHPQTSGSDSLPGRVNWLVGSNPRRWKRGLPTYGRVVQRNVYPGIDAEYYGRSGRFEYDLVVAPGAHPSTIRLRFAGASRIGLDTRGDALVTVRGATLRQTRPTAYQRVGTHRRAVSARYVLNADGTLGIATGDYDDTRPVVIDPVLSYSTYLGGGTFDSGESIAVDSSGAASVTGWTASADFPTHAALQPSDTAYDDAFVAKLSPAGDALVYATYFGGSNGDRAYGLALLPDGSTVVAGETSSTDFPTNASLKVCGTGIDQYTRGDGFVAKLAANGSSLAYSTCVGGLRSDRATSVAVDGVGAAYVTGWTDSTDFPVSATAAQQTLNGTGADAFVSKISPDGHAFIYSTYLGGDGVDNGNAISIYGGSAYVVGSTTSGDFPLVGSAPERHPGSEDAFLTKVASDGTVFPSSTLLGGTADDVARGVGTDSAGNVYVVGDTASTSFPTTHAIQPTNHGGRDGFVTKFEDGGPTIAYSTYLGGAGDDIFYGVSASPDGWPIAAGNTTSTDFPTENPLQGAHGGGGGDAMVSALTPDGSALNYSTYLGGTGDDGALGVARDTTGAVYLTGWTWTGGFPTANAYDSSPNGADDAFISKFTMEAETPAARFRPMLRFDSSENWRPLSLMAFFSESDPQTGQPFHRVCDAAGPCVPVSDPGSLVFHNPGWLGVGHFGTGSDASDYRSPYAVCNSAGLRDCDSGSTAGLYYHETAGGGYRYESYWAFYRYNDFGPDEHEGDWEGLNIAIDPAAPNSFVAAGFDQHGNIQWYLRNPFNLQCDVGGQGSCGSVGDGGSARRVWAYIASGSHASYPDRCVNSVIPPSVCRSGAEVGGVRLIEANHGGELAWGANMDATVLRATPGATSWADWPGRWGATCAPNFDCTFPAPKSPGRQSRYCWGGSGLLPDPGGHACPSRLRKHRNVAPSRCVDWFGTSIVALACSPSTLRSALRTGTLAGPTPFRLRLFGRPTHVVATRGVAQAFGAPLRGRDGVQLGGRLPSDTSLLVRGTTRRFMVEARFAGQRFVRAQGGKVVLETLNGRPRFVLRYKGRVVSPVRTHISRLQPSARVP